MIYTLCISRVIDEGDGQALLSQDVVEVMMRRIPDRYKQDWGRPVVDRVTYDDDSFKGIKGMSEVYGVSGRSVYDWASEYYSGDDFPVESGCWCHVFPAGDR